MTTKGEWVSYTGSDEQIDELLSATFIVDSIYSIFGNPKVVNTFYTGSMYEDDKHWLLKHFNDYGIKRYLLCNPHPYAEMIKRWADTGQAVYIRIFVQATYEGDEDCYEHSCTNTPDWNIPNAEYSFTAFEE